MFKGLLSISLAALIGYFSAHAVINYADSYGANHGSYVLQTDNSSRPKTQTPVSTSTGSSNDQTTPSTTEASTSNITTNWAGYVSKGGTYTSISGSWVVPSVDAEASDSIAADATWIGIGGVTSSDLIQIGTQDVVENGQVDSGSFYEELPDSSSTISDINVAAGDSITASIKEVSTNEWLINIKDNTNGESYSNEVYYDSSESSAEWIEEAPSDQSGVMSLDQFGSVDFSDANTTDDGSSDNLSSSSAVAVTMDNAENEELTYISTISSNGQNFSVTRSSADNSEYSNNDDYDTGASRDRFRTAPGGEVPDGFGQDGFGQY